MSRRPVVARSRSLRRQRGLNTNYVGGQRGGWITGAVPFPPYYRVARSLVNKTRNKRKGRKKKKRS